MVVVSLLPALLQRTFSERPDLHLFLRSSSSLSLPSLRDDDDDCVRRTERQTAADWRVGLAVSPPLSSEHTCVYYSVCVLWRPPKTLCADGRTDGMAALNHNLEKGGRVCANQHSSKAPREEGREGGGPSERRVKSEKEPTEF